ncbi:hypothetical protein CTI12_AA438640 [Artemisia annua]|uniref:Uncharacterized protein n=1 Tax=Artemisia annua TaxID=35608 RepID=A0A2U1L1I7_ARTAN|nr:hypothetical protein CTI12_AA438640 [Artemisia annua]
MFAQRDNLVSFDNCRTPWKWLFVHFDMFLIIPTIVTEVEVDHRDPPETLSINGDANINDDPLPAIEEFHVSGDANTNNDPLPALEGLQISGDAFPGREIQATGFAINGTVSCTFNWVHQSANGSIEYIEGTTIPTYIATFGDVGSFLGVKVIPIDEMANKVMP